MNIKTFTIHSVRNVFAFFIALGLGYVAYTVSPTSVVGPDVEAAVGGDLSGFAYSVGNGAAENDDKPGIGWISFNSKDCDKDTPIGFIDISCGGFTNPGGVANNGSNIETKDYVVNVNSTTGNFSGYAWGENIGWIKFDPIGPYPSLPNHGARLETSNTVTGWARACAGTVNGDCTGADRGDGWDGWIKLSKDPSDIGEAYSVTVNPSDGKFSGYAWGHTVVGWIDFAPSTGVDNVSLPPTPGTCEPSNSSYSCGAWDGTASCVSGEATQYNLPGTRTCFCTGLDPVIESSIAPTTICPRNPGAGLYITNDTYCDAGSGENFTNSPIDCKPKTRFWQF